MLSRVVLPGTNFDAHANPPAAGGKPK